MKSRLLILFLSLTLSIFSFHAMAADDQHETAAESEIKSDIKSDITVTVTAARTERAVSEVPAGVTVITREQLEHLSVPEAVRLYSGIDLRSFSGTPYLSQPSARGFTDNGQGRVLIMIDSIRMNNPDMAAVNWFDIPAGSIERIEVIKGGGSSLYGDYAVAGIINIITKKPDKGFAVSASAFQGSSNFSEYRADVSLGGDALSFSFSASDTESSGWRERTGFESTLFTSKLGYHPENSKTGFSVFLSAGNSFYELPGSLTMEQFKENPRKAFNLDDEVLTSTALFSGEGKYSITDTLNAVFTGSISSKSVESDMASWGSYTNSDITSQSFQPSLAAELPGFLYSSSITAGVDLSKDNLEIKRYSDKERESRNFKGDVSRSGYGLYSRAESYIFEPLLAVFSVRYDRTEYSADLSGGVDGKKAQAAFVWGSGISYLTQNNTKLYLKYDRLFRYPFLDEQIVYSGYGQDGFTEGLEPETGNSFDAGLEIHGSAVFSGGVNLYLLMMKDEISYNTMTFQNENMDETLRYGAESSFTFFPEGMLSLSGTFIYGKALFTSGTHKKNNVPLAPEIRFTLVPEIKTASKNAKIYSEITYTGESRQGGDFENTLDKIESFLVVNAGMEFKKETRSVETAVFGRMTNLFDTRYAGLIRYGGYYPGAGREFNVGVSIRY